MKIYHVTQSEVTGYDTYSDFIACAETEQEAKLMHPSYYYKSILDSNGWDWPNRIEDVECHEIGEANEDQTKGVICASFHAG